MSETIMPAKALDALEKASDDAIETIKQTTLKKEENKMSLSVGSTGSPKEVSFSDNVAAARDYVRRMRDALRVFEDKFCGNDKIPEPENTYKEANTLKALPTVVSINQDAAQIMNDCAELDSMISRLMNKL